MNRRNFTAKIFGGITAALGLKLLFVESRPIEYVVTEIDHVTKSITFDTQFANRRNYYAIGSGDGSIGELDCVYASDIRAFERAPNGEFQVKPGRERSLAKIRL